jgi:hypothetical protein
MRDWCVYLRCRRDAGACVSHGGSAGAHSTELKASTFDVCLSQQQRVLVSKIPNNLDHSPGGWEVMTCDKGA